MNPARLPCKVRVNHADDDARVLRTFPMQTDKVAAIQREQRAVFRGGKFQHFVVRHGLVGLAGFLNGQNAMAERAKFINTGSGKFSLE